HATLAEAKEGKAAVIQPGTLQFLVEERIERSSCSLCAHEESARLPALQGEPLTPHRRHITGPGRIGRDESGIGKEGSQHRGEADQVIPVRSEAVQKDHQLLRLSARLRIPPGPIELNGKCHLLAPPADLRLW